METIKQKEDEVPFTFDLEQMKKALASPKKRVPNFPDFESFEKWFDEEFEFKEGE